MTKISIPNQTLTTIPILIQIWNFCPQAINLCYKLVQPVWDRINGELKLFEEDRTIDGTSKTKELTDKMIESKPTEKRKSKPEMGKESPEVIENGEDPKESPEVIEQGEDPKEKPEKIETSEKPQETSDSRFNLKNFQTMVKAAEEKMEKEISEEEKEIESENEEEFNEYTSEEEETENTDLDFLKVNYLQGIPSNRKSV